MRTPHRTAAAALGVAGLLLLGACSGSDDPAVATLSGAEGKSAAAADDDAPTEEDVLAWVECMREQGIDIADPSVDGEGDVVLGAGPRVVIGRPGTISGSTSASGTDGDAPEPPDRDEFEKAIGTCGEPPRAGGSLSEEDRQAFQDAALRMAQCMRDQGVDFPDPVFSEGGPGGPATRTEEAPAAGERTGPFGHIDMDDAKVQAAFETCRGEVGDALPGPPGAVSRALPAGGEG